MRVYAQSLYRLFKAGKLTVKQIEQQLEKGRITQAEYNEIVGA